MNENTKTNLELALCPTDDILDELGKRFKDMIFCGLNEPLKGISDYKWKYKGDNATILGLCSWLQYRILATEMTWDDDKAKGNDEIS